MGAADERLLVKHFIDAGFGAYRYPQPAISIDPKYRKNEYHKIRRHQPVDFVVNGRLVVTDKDGNKRIIYIRIGGEQKSTSLKEFSRSSVKKESQLRFVEFCRVNCMVPAYFFIFRDVFDLFYSCSVGPKLEIKYLRDDAFVHFYEMMNKMIDDYLKIHDEYSKNYDEFEVVL